MERDFSSKFGAPIRPFVLERFGCRVFYWQSNGKAKKLCSMRLQLEMLRELGILVSFHSNPRWERPAGKELDSRAVSPSLESFPSLRLVPLRGDRYCQGIHVSGTPARHRSFP